MKFLFSNSFDSSFSCAYVFREVYFKMPLKNTIIALYCACLCLSVLLYLFYFLLSIFSLFFLTLESVKYV
jgi:hypothetical protein